MDTKLIDPAGFAGNAPVTYRTPPHNEEAEQTVLGAILVNNKAFEKVGEFLRPEHFFDPANQKIYQAVLKMIDRGQVANPITLKAYFEQDRDLSEIGGPEYLARLAAAIVTVHNLEDYGRIIHDAYLRRQLIEVGEDMVNQAYKHDIDVAANDQIEDAEKKLFELAATGDIKGDFIPFDRALTAAIATAEAAFRRSSHVTGVTSGLRDLDTKLGGLHPSDLLILAGRPSMGKTALATNIAFNAAKAHMLSGGKEGAPVGFFSLEMSAEQLALRILADQAEVSGDKIRRGEITATDFPKFVEASQYLARVPFFVDDTPALTITAVRTRARRLKRTHGLGLVVVDYLQLLRGGGSGRGEQNRVQEISEITRGLKAIAKELDLPVIALSQLSRSVESREDKRPQLSDLRESGSIEQDADVVMFVFREQYYLERAEPGRRPDESEDKYNDRYAQWQDRLAQVHNTADVIIGKQRHGPVGTVRLYFDGNYTRFGDLDTQHGGGSYDE
ncbi:replicative DNA helicase [Niveispirillum sp.]|uniref:replicative DNA helicase n=1 Tax=Niveispirillum sp. TaxID=1917217 RepID=UPI001B524735|nr:replicative DNA helicase [Niveispirillum sp.]MBP7336509.1 replicative DNA helicase [Niveispirillum sp.]